MNLTKEESRQRWNELRRLVISWDPLGLILQGAPKDEYDCLIQDILKHLQTSRPAKQLAEHLQSHISEHFGVATNLAETNAFVNEAYSWYKDKWHGSIV